jgi:PAS domain S-box-containing protein
MGYEPGTFPGTDEALRALIHPDSVTAHEEARKRVRGEIGIFQEELHFRLRDGSERWGLLRGQMLRDERGEPDRIVGVQFDITERKRMEAQTAALERLGFLLGAAHDPVEAAHAIVDTAREIWNWDACFVLSHDAVQNQITHLINYDTIDGRRERVPRSNPEATPTPMVRRVLQFGAQLILRGEGDAPAPDTSRFGDTARVSQSLMYAPIRHRDGGIGVISVQSYRRKAFTNQDLQTLQALADHCGGTLARLQAEAGLHHSEERFRTVVEQAPDAIVVQIDRKFAYANPAAVRLFGASNLSGLLRQPVLDRIAPPLRAAVSERIRQLNENLPQVAPMEMACVRLDGSTVEVEATSVPFTYEHEPGALIFLRDITERRQAENASIEQRNLGLALSATDDLGEAVQLCLDAAMRISSMDAGGIYLINEQTGELDLVVHHGLSPDFVRTVAHYAADDPYTARVREGNAIHLRYADLDLPKRETESNEGLRAITVLPIKHEARVIAVLNVASHQIDVLPPVTRHTLESVATQIGAVIARLRVEESLRKSERQLRALSGRLESMREEERTRISREIHDELGQMLTGIRMDLGSIEHELGAFEGDPRVSSMVERLVAATELTEMTIRTVQRIAAELRPGILDKLGLDMALQYEVDQFRKRTGLACRLSLPENPQTMNANVATAFFRICQEALTNVARHARATAVEVALRTGGGGLELTVRDNGQGMADADRADFKSLGLLGMQERARQIGGSVTFTSPPDGGTLVALRVPTVPSPAEQP